MKYLPICAVSILAIGTAAAQTPDSTVMNLSVEGGASVPVTTIIPVAQTPIQEVDTTYVRTSPPSNNGRPRHKKGCKHSRRDSLHRHTKESLSDPQKVKQAQ